MALIADQVPSALAARPLNAQDISSVQLIKSRLLLPVPKGLDVTVRFGAGRSSERILHTGTAKEAILHKSSDRF